MSKFTNFYIDGYPVKNYGYTGGRHSNGYKTLKLFLLEKYKVCYHCRIEVINYPYIEGEAQLDDSATIDHLKPRQLRKKFEVVEKVLSCRACNHFRNEEMKRGSDE